MRGLIVGVVGVDGLRFLAVFGMFERLNGLWP